MTAITYHQLDNTAHTDNNWNDYQKKRWAALEAFEACKFDFYVDTVGKVTTGLGFNVGDNGVRTLVIEKLLEFTAKKYGDGAQAFINEIDAALSHSYTISTETVQMNKDVVAAKTSLNATLNEILARWNTAYNAGGSQLSKAPPTTLTIDKGDYPTPKDRVIAFFNNSFAKRYEDILNSRAPGVEYSSERIALFSLVYNAWSGGINSDLKKAIATGVRSEAWYQIRYNTNIGEKMRHLAEAELFGLYDNQTAPSQDDTVNALKMYTKYRDNILTKDVATKSLFNTANGKLNQIGLGGTVEAIDKELLPAINYIKQNGYDAINSIPGLFATVQGLDGEFLIGDHPGDNEDDVIGGSSFSLDKSDLLMGLTGDDVLVGGRGNDVLLGGSGDNTLYGNDDDDKIYGGDNDDFIIGGSGNDTIESGYGSGTDDVYGGDGDDSITGGGDTVSIYGDAGNDTITVKGNHNRVEGGDGNDTITRNGYGLDDWFIGDAGDDTLTVSDGSAFLEGGVGKDTYNIKGSGIFFIVDTDNIGTLVIGGKTVGTLKAAGSGSANDKTGISCRDNKRINKKIWISSTQSVASFASIAIQQQINPFKKLQGYGNNLQVAV